MAKCTKKEPGLAVPRNNSHSSYFESNQLYGQPQFAYVFRFRFQPQEFFFRDAGFSKSQPQVYFSTSDDNIVKEMLSLCNVGPIDKLS